MTKFWEMMAESTIVQASVTLLFSVTVCYMFVKGVAIPPLLAASLGTVMGFWFGSKSQMLAHKRANGIKGRPVFDGDTPVVTSGKE